MNGLPEELYIPEWHYRCTVKENFYMQTSTTQSSTIPENIPFSEPVYDIAQIMGGLYGDGFIGLKNAFGREWVKQLHEDVMIAYEDALKHPGGAVGRGPK